MGIYKNAQQACEKYVEFDEKVYEPIQEHVLVYREAYAVFRKLYERTVDLMELV